MARKPPKVEESEETPQRKDHKALLAEMRENVKLDLEADQHNRDSYRDALKFCYVKGEQWEQTVKKSRGPKRVTREFNETRVKVKSVVNHIRSNRPTAKIRPVEEGDVDTAEAMNGIWLNIWNTSDADNITDFAAETQVAAGMGAWMVDTEYVDDSVDDQEIFIRSIRNPLCLIPDRACKEQDKSDARHWTYATKISKSAYKAKYKGKEISSFEPEDFGGTDDLNDDADSVWIAAYWKKVPATRRLAKLITGETVDLDKTPTLPEQIAQKADGTPAVRSVSTHKIVQYICSSTAVLEGPNEWAGKEFPFVIVYGEYVVVDGKTYWSGMTQTMMDAQRSHNETLSGVYETIALSPQAKYWATAKQGSGLLTQWNAATEENLLVMLYNHDPAAPGPPVRVGGADVPAALMQASQMSRDSINSVSSVPDANVGLTSNESSGRAIRARQDSGLVGTYNYPDNIAKGIGRTCKIILDLAPKVIDTPRSLRILGKDGAEKYIKVNARDALGNVVNDLSKGRYDFVVTQGPNVATQRQEAAETLTSLAQSDEMLMPTAGDIVYRNLDIPGAAEIAERRRAMLPPAILAMIDKDKPQAPEVVAAMQQIEQLQAQLQEQAQVVQQATTEAQTEKAGADKAKADVQIALANLKTQEANIATDVANFQKLVAETQAKMTAEQTVTSSDNDREQLTAQVGQALADIQTQAAQLMQGYAEQMAAIMQSMQQPQVVVANPPKQKQVVIRRMPTGELVGTVDEVVMQ